jgi:hypothetical protein
MKTGLLPVGSSPAQLVKKGRSPFLTNIEIAPTRAFSPINGRKNTLSAQSIFFHAHVAAKNDPNCSPPLRAANSAKLF